MYSIFCKVCVVFSSRNSFLLLFINIWNIFSAWGSSICILKFLFWYTIHSSSLRESESSFKINPGYLMHQTNKLYYFPGQATIVFHLWGVQENRKYILTTSTVPQVLFSSRFCNISSYFARANNNLCHLLTDIVILFCTLWPLSILPELAKFML